MQEKFTRQAVNALKLARSTVQSCKHTYIGTEHILVGLLKEKEGTAGRILEEFGVEQERLQELIGNLIAPSEVLTMERVPEYSPRAQRLLDNAGKEAQMRRADQAGTEHILLAMLKETESVATRLLYTMGVNIQKLYAAVLAAMGCDQEAIAEEMQASRNLKDKKGIVPQALPFYAGNKFYLFYKKIYPDVRMVAAPPSSIGKFGGDTDNWMWPRHTGDFSVFRVYANADNKPAEYNADNKPYTPRYVAEVSMQGYQDKDYAMTIGFPGSTDRYLCSWGVQQRIENSNKPRIEVRGIKQGIWKEAMLASDAVRIKYASKYAGSSNYWKNSIGMNKGLANLNVIERKRAEETAFADWVAKDQARGAKYGEVLNLLEKGYTSTNKYREALTYLNEAFSSGAEIIRLARMVQSVDIEGATPEEITVFLEDRIQPFFKDYEPSLDQKVLAAMMKIAKERVSPEFLPDIYTSVDKKYKGNYEKYAADVFKKTSLLSYDKIAEMLRNPKQYEKLRKDPAAELSLSVLVSIFQLQQLMGDAEYDIAKGERLYFAGLKEMYPEKALSSDANFTMRLSYGSIGGYRPYDAAWYNYYSTDKGILEKEDPTSDEFWVQPEILDLVRSRDFGPYANEKGELQLCFLSNNDITGGNSGSPVFDKNARLIGLAFDGNWEAMSGDIAFEPDLQRCIGVDIRYVLFMIDKWGKCPRLIEELKLVR